MYMHMLTALQYACHWLHIVNHNNTLKPKHIHTIGKGDKIHTIGKRKAHNHTRVPLPKFTTPGCPASVCLFYFVYYQIKLNQTKP